MPRPVSSTRMRTSDGAASALRVTAPPSDTARTALSSRYSSACPTRWASARIGFRLDGQVTVRVAPRASIRSRTRSAASSSRSQTRMSPRVSSISPASIWAMSSTSSIEPASWLAAMRMAPACWRLRSGRSAWLSSSSE